MLTEKQEQEFVRRYKERYWDTSKETGTWKLPRLPADKQLDEVKARVDFLKKLLGRNANKIYIHRWGRKESRLSRAFNGLYFNYWPDYYEADGKPSTKFLWIEDILDAKPKKNGRAKKK